jgi:hypothetical protein
MKKPIYIFFYPCLLFSILVNAQIVSVSSINKDSVYIGDIVEVAIKTRIPKSVKFKGVDFGQFAGIQNLKFESDTIRYENNAD